MNVKTFRVVISAKALMVLALYVAECSVSAADPNQYYKVIKLNPGEIYQGALIPNESTNLAAEIVIFDCQAKVKRGPLRTTDGYHWVRLREKPCGGFFVVLDNSATQKLHDENPTFWNISGSAVAYVANDDNEAVVISAVDLRDTNILSRITNSFPHGTHWGDNVTGNVMIKYTLKESGSGSKTVSLSDFDGKVEKQLEVFHVNDKKAYYQIKSAAKAD